MDNTYTNQDVANIVDSEGLGYALLYYMGSGGFEDEVLASLWDAAQVALEDLNAYLKKSVEDYDG